MKQDLHVYNSKTQKREKFVPLDAEAVQMYVCGPTTYDSAHLGHARAAVAFDVLYRLLRSVCGYNVNYVRNFTDIDDKIIARAQERDQDPFELSDFYAREYTRDVTDLGTLPPSVQPKVTENIENIISMISTLIEKGHAYVSEGNVYFSIASDEEYGKLSGRDTESMLAGQRVDVDFLKKDPLDFALWKKAKENEPSWESPWGPGRPGWHIECSAMSAAYGAATLDIHGGGRDLLFPHHENEVAQSECCNGQEFVRYWVHNGFVNVGDEKMSKSLHNFVTVREILDRFPRTAVRLFLLSSQYRSVLEFTWSAIGESLKTTERFYALRGSLEQYAAQATQQETDNELDAITEKAEKDILQALLEDMNTPVVLAALHEMTTATNRWLDSHPKQKTRLRMGGSWQKQLALWTQLSEWTGLLADSPQTFQEELKEKGLKALGISESKITDLLEARNNARSNKDWAEADRIRDELDALGVTVQDLQVGSSWQLQADAIASAIIAQ